MAFMALFGWMLLPVLLLVYILQVLTAPVVWAIEHPGIAYAIAAGVLALNLLILRALLRRRGRWKQEGRKNGFVSLLAVLWEVCAVVFCALFLLARPLRFLPPDFGQLLPTMASVDYGTWEITECQGVAPGCTRSQEQMEQYLGLRLTYEPHRFISGEETYSLDHPPYDERVARRKDGLRVPGSAVGMSFESLGLDRSRVRRVTVSFRERPDEQVIGWFFYLLDRDTLLVCYDAMFFRAERVE